MNRSVSGALQSRLAAATASLLRLPSPLKDEEEEEEEVITSSPPKSQWSMLDSLLRLPAAATLMSAARRSIVGLLAPASSGSPCSLLGCGLVLKNVGPASLGEGVGGGVGVGVGVGGGGEEEEEAVAGEAPVAEADAWEDPRALSADATEMTVASRAASCAAISPAAKRQATHGQQRQQLSQSGTA